MRIRAPWDDTGTQLYAHGRHFSPASARQTVSCYHIAAVLVGRDLRKCRSIDGIRGFEGEILDIRHPLVLHLRIRMQLKVREDEPPACEELPGNLRMPLGSALDMLLAVVVVAQPPLAHMLKRRTTQSFLRSPAPGVLLPKSPAAAKYRTPSTDPIASREPANSVSGTRRTGDSPTVAAGQRTRAGVLVRVHLDLEANVKQRPGALAWWHLIS